MERLVMCSKLIKKAPERPYWRRSGVFIVHLEQISNIADISIVDF